MKISLIYLLEVYDQSWKIEIQDCPWTKYYEMHDAILAKESILFNAVIFQRPDLVTVTFSVMRSLAGLKEFEKLRQDYFPEVASPFPGKPEDYVASKFTIPINGILHNSYIKSIDELKQELQQCIEEENYKKAAEIKKKLGVAV